MDLRRQVVGSLVALSLAAGAWEVAFAAATSRSLTTAQVAAVDRFVENEMALTHIPGAAVGIYSRGDILLAKGFGLANVELNVPVKPETVFESGSVGKQFVSAA